MKQSQQDTSPWVDTASTSKSSLSSLLDEILEESAAAPGR